MSSTVMILLCISSGACYVAATVLLKFGGGLPFVVLLLPVYVALGLAAWFESLSLAGNRIGLIALTIGGAEVVLTILVALVAGERYGMREVAGLALIVAGMAVVFGIEEAPSATPDAATERAVPAV